MFYFETLDSVIFTVKTTLNHEIARKVIFNLIYSLLTRMATI